MLFLHLKVGGNLNGEYSNPITRLSLTGELSGTLEAVAV
jgi:hypothetical protein